MNKQYKYEILGKDILVIAACNYADKTFEQLSTWTSYIGVAESDNYIEECKRLETPENILLPEIAENIFKSYNIRKWVG